MFLTNNPGCTASSKINGAKFSDTCSVRANWLCMGWPFCQAEMRRKFQTGGKIFCTTLYFQFQDCHLNFIFQKCLIMATLNLKSSSCTPASLRALLRRGHGLKHEADGLPQRLAVCLVPTHQISCLQWRHIHEHRADMTGPVARAPQERRQQGQRPRRREGLPHRRSYGRGLQAG